MILRMVWRPLRSATSVTLHVLMMKMSAPCFSSTVVTPAFSRLCRIVEVSEKFSLHPRVMYAAFLSVRIIEDCEYEMGFMDFIRMQK